jgi:hypothetical protein
LSREGEQVTTMDLHSTQLIPAVDVSGSQPTLQCYSYSSRSNEGRQSKLVETNEALCDTTITQMIHGLDLSMPLASDSLFQAVLKTTRTVGSKYSSPNRKVVGSSLLDTNYNTMLILNKKELEENSKIAGL